MLKPNTRSWLYGKCTTSHLKLISRSKAREDKVQIESPPAADLDRTISDHITADIAKMTLYKTGLRAGWTCCLTGMEELPRTGTGTVVALPPSAAGFNAAGLLPAEKFESGAQG